ncbi:unnamed protein product [Parnassius apollo]|uniref:(apollo) hypothetical protein n=1 Tax=Parnassius apollo TaxID=110799 RepID=A0A8S3XWA3_PARAO|nr:unnamed protein product [Parnassius apollo]
MDLKSLIESDYELNIVENMKMFAEKRANTFERKMNSIENLSRTKVINIFDGLEAVRTTKTALLCDYPGAYSIIARTFENEEICEMKEVDVFSNIKMYFFAAKKFHYIEKLKIGTLRMKESGIMKRIIAKNDYTPLSCTINAFHKIAQFDHILSPLIIMLVAYVLVCAILVAERIHNGRNKVWPYTE